MPSPLSVGLRECVVASLVAGTSCHRATARFGVSMSSASRWSERFRHEGQLASKPMGGNHSCLRNSAPAGEGRGDRQSHLPGYRDYRLPQERRHAGTGRCHRQPCLNAHNSARRSPRRRREL